jgi:type II secretory pathway component GspD/PulD (secretin)
VVFALAALSFAGCATGSAAKRGADAVKRGEWDAAVAYYREAISQDPKRIEYQIELERATRAASNQHVLRGRELEQQDQLAGAAAEYRQAVEFDPSNSLALARALSVERRLRDQIDAARPKSRVEELQRQANQASPIPRLDPRLPLGPLKFTNSNVRDVLNTIGTATGIGIQYDQGLESFLSRAFTVDLTGHSLESAFNMVLSQSTLAYKIIDSHTIFIYQDNAQMRAKYEDQYQQVFYMSHADAQEMNQILNQMLTTTTGNRPIITQNKTANTIIVRASAPMLGLIKNIIDTNDKPKAEVLIEVTILEVDRQRMKDLGLDLSNYAIGLSFSPEQRPAGPGVIPPIPAPPIQGQNLRAGSGGTSVYVTLPSAVINLMESDQKTKLLAKPQLRGREGQPLTLNLGDSVPVPQTTFLPVATGGVATQPQVSYVYQSIGVNLSITPKVTYDDEIILDPIMVDKSALGQDLVVSGQSLPTFVKRSAQVSMRLRDGESNLLAGLISQEDKELAKSLPGINRIPVLRAMFGNVTGTTTSGDLVMIVTPHIIRSREITADDLKPFYVGTTNNLGAAAQPALISQVPPPVAGANPPAAGATSGGVTTGGATTGAANTGGTATTGGAVPVVSGAVPVVAAPPPGAAGNPPVTGNPPATGGAATSATGGARPTGVVAVQPVTSGAPAAAAPAQILLTVPTSELQMGGQPYTVPVSVTGVSELGALTITITYDPKILKATSVSPGTFMQQGNVTPTFAPKIDEATGRIDIAISRGANAPGAAGTGLLAGLVFQGVAAGTSKVTVTGTAFTPDGKPISIQLPAPTSVIVK